MPTFQLPEASTTNRPLKATSRHRFNGAIVDPRTNRLLIHRNRLQAGFIYMMLIDPTVAYVEDRPDAISYVNGEGKKVDFKLDYRVFFRDGSKMGARVCYGHVVDKWHVDRELATLGKQIGSTYADRLRLYTEKTITSDVSFNARTVFHCGGMPLSEINQSLLAFVSTLQGAVTIGALVTAFDAQDGVYRHVISLIQHGYLVKASAGRLDHSTYVKRPKRQEAA